MEYYFLVVLGQLMLGLAHFSHKLFSRKSNSFLPMGTLYSALISLCSLPIFAILAGSALAVDGDLASAHADHESMRGKVAIDWAKDGEKTSITLTVPFGTHGTLYLPESYAGKLSENGAVLPCVLENGKSVFQFASGVYTLEA
jgi:hypothetical protein